MSVFLKPIGCLAMIAATIAGLACSPETHTQGTDMSATAKSEPSVTLPHPPLKIPMPLDKAGYKVDVTFEVPPLPRGETHFNYFVGLRILFTPGSDTVPDALDKYPIAARISLARIENGQDIPLPLRSRTRRPAPGHRPHRGDEVFDISEVGEAIAAHYYTQLSNAPRGTPDAAAFVLSFASARPAGVPGIYRLQAETLDNIPALSGATSFFVLEEYVER